MTRLGLPHDLRTRPAEDEPDHGFTLRHPCVADAAQIHDIVVTSGLDVNSRYIYNRWCADFSATTALAERGGEVAAFIMCYPRPVDSARMFIWQAGVRDRYQGLGLAGRLLNFVSDGYRYIECTVAPSNRASLRFLQKFATERGGRFTVTPFLTEEDLGHGHEPEELVVIGPLQGGNNDSHTIRA